MIVKTNIIIVTNGTAEDGLGHVFRSMALARGLGSWADVKLVVKQNGILKELISRRGFSLTEMEVTGRRLVHSFKPVCVIYDLPPGEDFETYRETMAINCFSVGIHDMGLGYPRGDVIVDGGIVQVTPYRRESIFHGLQYMILHSSFRQHRRRLSRYKVNSNTVFISLGGGMAREHLKTILSAIQNVENIVPRVVIGPYYTENQYNQFLELLAGRGEIIQNTLKFARYLSESGLAIVGGGITMYESLCLGVPTIVVPMNKFQDMAAEQFHQFKAALNMGIPGSWKKETLVDNVQNLLRNKRKSLRMSLNGQQLVDGEGVKRVSILIGKALGGRLAA